MKVSTGTTVFTGLAIGVVVVAVVGGLIVLGPPSEERTLRLERFVGVFQLEALGHQFVQLEAALQVEIDVPGHVHPKVVRTHAAALDLLLLQEGRAVEFDLLPLRDHSDDRGDLDSIVRDSTLC